MDAIYIAAPEGTTWPLAGQDIERLLEARFPDVRIQHKYAPVSRANYTDFEMTVDGEVRHGSYFDHRHLILRDGTPELWADDIVWFLGLLPPGTPAVAMVESNPDTIPAIPPAATVHEIRELLDGLLADV
ncbi:hypothetical protein [Kitasatospora griseola]|uniref:hypothetical protein n=1 Tax=Kitasatospora griseola TaxID=2064 RepID=UPI0037F858F9